MMSSVGSHPGVPKTLTRRSSAKTRGYRVPSHALPSSPVRCTAPSRSFGHKIRMGLSAFSNVSVFHFYVSLSVWLYACMFPSLVYLSFSLHEYLLLSVPFPMPRLISRYSEDSLWRYQLQRQTAYIDTSETIASSIARNRPIVPSYILENIPEIA